ncbi:MAG: hypothetical protein ACE37H_08045 [Phycisphaeraceae bacterium]
MTGTTPQRLLQIDSAVRTPGGLADLIQYTPDIEAWLNWIIEVAKTPACGALEELRYNRELSDAASTSTSDGLLPLDACPIHLVENKETLVSPRRVAAGMWRFAIARPGSVRLYTRDQTLLWSEELATKIDNADNNSVWRLAAASEPSGSLVQRWMIPGWMLTVEHFNSVAGHWLDVIDHVEATR